MVNTITEGLLNLRVMFGIVFIDYQIGLESAFIGITISDGYHESLKYIIMKMKTSN